MNTLLVNLVLLSCPLIGILAQTDSSDSEAAQLGVYKIEGKVTPPDVLPPNWLSRTSVTIDGGKRKAFLKEDNSFVFQVC